MRLRPPGWITGVSARVSVPRVTTGSGKGTHMSGRFSFRHRLVQCPRCRRPMAADSPVCPHCDFHRMPKSAFVPRLAGPGQSASSRTVARAAGSRDGIARHQRLRFAARVGAGDASQGNERVSLARRNRRAAARPARRRSDAHGRSFTPRPEDDRPPCVIADGLSPIIEPAGVLLALLDRL